MELRGPKWPQRVRRRERTTRWLSMPRRERLFCSVDMVQGILVTRGNGMARFGLSASCPAHHLAPSIPWPMTRLVGKLCCLGAVRCGQRPPIARPGSGTALLGLRYQHPGRFRDANTGWPSIRPVVVRCCSGAAMEPCRSVIHGNGMALRGLSNHPPAPRREQIRRWRLIRFGRRLFCLAVQQIVRAGRGRGMASHGLKPRPAIHQIEHSIRWPTMRPEIES